MVLDDPLPVDPDVDPDEELGVLELEEGELLESELELGELLEPELLLGDDVLPEAPLELDEPCFAK